MAINRDPSSTDQLLKLDFNNGDLEALRSTAQRLGFRNEESMLRFALAVMAQSEGRIVYVEKSDKKIGLQPSADLLAEQPQETDTNITNE